MGAVENIYLSKLSQVNEILESKLSSAGISSTKFSDIFNKTLEDTSSDSRIIKIEKNTKTLKELPNEDRYDSLIAEAARKYDLDPNLIKAVMRYESQFKRYALSGAGAMGLMQLMPGTAASLGVDDAYDPAQNIEAGARYLRKQINRFGDVRLALAGYNTGPNRVASYGIQNPDNEEEYNRISERVRGYVDIVLGNYIQYCNQSDF